MIKKDIQLISRLNKDWRPENIKITKAGGQTNRNYIVQHENKKFFVRLPWETAVINRKIEGKNILALNRNKKLKQILPRYYLYILNNKNILNPKSRETFNLPDGTMLAEYIEGKLFDLSLFKTKRYQEKLAKLFNIFHTSDVCFVNEYDVFRDELAKYRVAVERHAIPKFIDIKTILNLKKIEKEVKNKITILKKGVPAHNDFLFQNIIVGNDGKLYLLDFEYAGMNERGGILYDLGYFFADNVFRNPPVDKTLYDKFLKVVDEVYNQCFDRNQIYWLAIAVPVMQVWWGLLRYFSVSNPKGKKYFKDYVLKRTEGIEFLYKLIKKRGLERISPHR